MYRASRSAFFVLALCLTFLADISARAETLVEALASAYGTNPTVRAERAKLRATDEEVPKALSGYRPRLTIEGHYSYSKGNGDGPGSGDPNNTDLLAGSAILNGERESWGYEIKLEQPIFTGFQTLNNVKEAKARVYTGREELRDVQQTVLLQTVRAYADVVRDRKITRFRLKNVQSLTTELRGVRHRFKRGDATRTDILQTKARRARALSKLHRAKASLKASRAEYERVVGHQPVGLVEPRIPRGLLPSSINEAAQIAHQENPRIAAAQFREKASRHRVNAIRGEFLPKVNLEAKFEQVFFEGDISREIEDLSIMLRVAVPLYQAGEVSARVRQAKEINTQRLIEITETTREVFSQVESAWARYLAENDRINQARITVEQNKTALAGTRRERDMGERTTFDVLNADLELVEAKVALEERRRDLVVAAYEVIATLGRLTAKGIGLPGDLYDPTIHYHNVHRKIWGTAVADDPNPKGPVHTAWGKKGSK